jgi:hypothetical protein
VGKVTAQVLAQSDVNVPYRVETRPRAEVARAR